MNNVCLIGRLTRDIELRYVGERAVANFTLAVDKNLAKEKKQEFEAANKPTADFIQIAVWGRRAETCANYLSKGSKVGVVGRIETGSYDAEDGSKRYTTNVVASNVEFLDSKADSGRNNNNQGNAGGGNDFSDVSNFHPIEDDDIPF